MSDEGLTIDKINSLLDMVRAVAPIPMFGQTILAPPGKAVTFFDRAHEYVIANPEFWAQFEHGVMTKSIADRPNLLGNYPAGISLSGVRIIDLDAEENAGSRKQFNEAFVRAMAAAQAEEDAKAFLNIQWPVRANPIIKQGQMA